MGEEAQLEVGTDVELIWLELEERDVDDEEVLSSEMEHSSEHELPHLW